MTGGAPRCIWDTERTFATHSEARSGCFRDIGLCPTSSGSPLGREPSFTACWATAEIASMAAVLGASTCFFTLPSTLGNFMRNEVLPSGLNF